MLEIFISKEMMPHSMKNPQTRLLMLFLWKFPKRNVRKKAYFIISKKPAMWNLRNVFATDILLPTTHDYRWIMSRWRKVSYIKIS